MAAWYHGTDGSHYQHSLYLLRRVPTGSIPSTLPQCYSQAQARLVVSSPNVAPFDLLAVERAFACQRALDQAIAGNLGPGRGQGPELSLGPGLAWPLGRPES